MLYQDWAAAGIEIPVGKSGEFDMLCPQCSAGRSTAQNRRHKCLSVNTDKGVWECHNCQWTGGIMQQDWRNEAKLPRKFIRPEPVVDASLSKASIAFFESRMIELDVVKRNGIYSGSWFGKDAIVFPFTRDGEVVIEKFRLKNKDFRVTADAEAIPWGLDGIGESDTVYIVEGEIDRLTIEQVMGTSAILSVPSGSSASDAVQEMICKAVERASKVVLAGDMDEPGQKMLETLARRIGFDRCWTVTWPVKDANDTLMEYGADAVRECIDGAKPWPVQGIITFHDLEQEYMDLYDRGMPPGLSTGCPELDNYFTVALGELTVVTGSPGSGKTRFLDWLVHNLGQPVGLCSMETVPMQRHMARLAQLETGKPFRDGLTQRMTREEAREAHRVLAERFTFIMPESPTIDSVLEAARALIHRSGVTILVVDPWNRLEHARDHHLSETEYAHKVLSSLQRFAVNYDVHIPLVGHPRKLYKKPEDADYPVATPYDISGSAGFFNIADNCLSIWRSKSDLSKPVQVHVQKIRNDENGGLGMVPYSFDAPTGRYAAVGNNKVVSFGTPVAPWDRAEEWDDIKRAGTVMFPDTLEVA